MSAQLKNLRRLLVPLKSVLAFVLFFAAENMILLPRLDGVDLVETVSESSSMSIESPSWSS